MTRSLKTLIATGFVILLTTAAMAAPKAPTNLSATPYNYTQISLSWIDQSSNESGFRIERGSSSSGPWTTAGTVGANATSFAAAGLTGSTTYYFRVFATSTSGDSPSSNVAGATTPAPPVQGPAAPSALQATAVSAFQINLTWTDNSSNETGFKLERATASAGPWSQISAPGANATSYVVTSLNPTTTYYFRVRATNGSGDSAYSAVASATTPAAPPPNPTPPTNVTATAVSPSQINLSWTDTTAYESGYVIERLSGGYWVQIASLPANYTSYSNTGLTAGISYTYRVDVTSSSGGLFYGPQVTATTQTALPSLPAAPSGLVSAVVSSSQINLTWVDNSTNETGFNVERATATAGPWTTIATTGSNVVAYSSTGLASSTTYYFRVRSFNTSGSSAYTSVVTATTQTIATLPVAPTSLSATGFSTSQINLVWVDNSTNEQGFSIERGSSASGPWSVLGTTALSSYSNTGLTASTTYYYRVRAYNTAGYSAYSGTSSAATFVATNDTTDPTMPSTVLVTSPTCGGIKVTWSTSQDLGGSGLKGYNVYRKNSITPVQILSPTTSFVDTGLPPATYYYYTVAAVDNAGNESTKTAAAGAYTLSCAGSGGDHQWSKNAGGVIYPDDGFAAAMDGSGNSYVTGDFSGSTDFGLGALVSAGSRDAYVAKYRADGTLVWAKRFGGPYDDFGQGIAVDSSGNVLVTGKFQGASDLGSGMTSTGGYDIFLAKFSGADGRVLWSKRMGSTGADEAAALALDSAGDVVITGQFFGNVDFGGGLVTNASSYVQIFVAKYRGADGSHVWSKRLGKLVATSPTTVGSGRGISVDPSNNVVISGYFGGPVDFGGGALTSAGGMDVFVAKYAGTDGHWLWAKRFGDASDQHANAVATDNSGNVLVTGDFISSIDFGGGALPPSSTTQTIFLAKLAAADGGYQWARSFVAAGLNVGSYGWAVATDEANNAIISGQMSGPVDFGGGPLNNVGGVFAAKYGPTGVHQWSKDFRGGGGQGRGVAVGSNNQIVITGSFDSIQDFGGGDLRSAGNTGSDYFLLSLLP